MKRTTCIPIAALLLCALCSATVQALPAPRPTIVLVHGAWETAAIWRPVAGQLRAHGYRVIAVNLPGRPGASQAAEAISLAAYRDTVLAAIKDETAPVVLVGHSFGGVTVTNVAEAAPARIKTLVYLAAFVPQDGRTLLALAQADTGSQLPPHLALDKSRGVMSVETSARAEVFANDATAAQRAEVPAMLVDEPVQPMMTPVQLTSARSGSVDRVYIRTLQDKALSPAFQSQMIAAAPMRMTIDLDTGHSPFLTAPTALVAAIEQVAQ
ncbi:alpha/beta fold hydrolase [Xanthomonas cannabis]|uniref:alpha/beta fold hydrolase n=1 Tax=Xanthomonas cannabis TaxID=1885674 RepID=UPI00141AB440|nr:alpha/beta fold hydrolase [Xanthomonas cannabis]NIK19138.1 pimeloyl-ACP methyl ester carboxylesterase [Xanthomonas cannabis]